MAVGLIVILMDYITMRPVGGSAGRADRGDGESNPGRPGWSSAAGRAGYRTAEPASQSAAVTPPAAGRTDHGPIRIEARIVWTII